MTANEYAEWSEARERELDERDRTARDADCWDRTPIVMSVLAEIQSYSHVKLARADHWRAIRDLNRLELFVRRRRECGVEMTQPYARRVIALASRMVER